MRETSTGSTVRERRLLDAARDGDEDAFRELIAPRRGGLHAHCYRMLGSLHDAEDALQDTLLRAWRGLPRLNDAGSLRPWLFRIATNVCLEAIARRPRRVLPIDYGPPAGPDDEPGAPLDESVWVEPYPDAELGLETGYAAPAASYEQRESVELAFVAALQHLTGRQRAVLVLREVLGFSAREVAEALETTVASVNSALQRARRTIGERLPQESQQGTMRTLGDERVRDLVHRFMDAFENDDVDAILAMLVEDATFAMPPYAAWYRGRDAIADSWLMPGPPPGSLRYVPTSANGQPALGVYRLDPRTGGYLPLALDVLTLRGARLADVTVFRTPGIFPRFGLPDVLAASG